MIKKCIYLFIILLLITLSYLISIPLVRGASGLAVSPAGLLIQKVKPGETYDISEVSGVTLNITNKDNDPHTYIISVHRPSTVAARKWTRGYLEIPDPSFFRLEKDEVRIAANETAKVRMFIEIPDEERYYNQHWSVSLYVRVKAEPGQMVALAAAPRFEIETVAKGGIKKRPDGLIAFEPHLIEIENLVPGSMKEAKVRLYNNDQKRHNYNIIPMIFVKNTEKGQIRLSPGYTWIPDLKWLKLKKKKLNVGPEGVVYISFSVKVPENPIHFNQNWEAILFCEPDEGLSGFIRVRIVTKMDYNKNDAEEKKILSAE